MGPTDLVPGCDSTATDDDSLNCAPHPSCLLAVAVLSGQCPLPSSTHGLPQRQCPNLVFLTRLGFLHQVSGPPSGRLPNPLQPRLTFLLGIYCGSAQQQISHRGHPQSPKMSVYEHPVWVYS